MIGLDGSKVILIDDEHKDAIPLIQAFSSRGVPVSYFDGSAKGLPKRDNLLKGVRLAILDMNLVPGTREDKSKATTLVSYLKKILSPDNGPYAVVAWTTHTELFDLFKSYLFQDNEIPNPVCTVMISKSACKNRKREYDISIIGKKLDEGFNNASPLKFMQGWEGKCFFAASEVTNTLSGISISNCNTLEDWIDSWEKEFLKILKAMAIKQVGQNINNDTIMQGLYNSLNPLHEDRLDNNSLEIATTFTKDAVKILAVQGQCSEDQNAKINSMLHLAPVKIERLLPGNIYYVPTKNITSPFPSVDKLLDGFMRDKPQQEKFKTLKKREGFKRKIEQFNASKGEIKKTSQNILIEINPNCDHAQKKIKLGRFIAGLMVPVEHEKKIKGEADFMKKYGPFKLEKPLVTIGNYNLYLDARYILSCSLKASQKLQPVLRLRSHTFDNLLFWISNHASRPSLILFP